MAPQEWIGEESIADLAASFLTSRAMPEAAAENLQQIAAISPQIAMAWTRAQAVALATGAPAVPLPDAERVPADRVQGSTEKLSTLPPLEVIGAIHSASADEQLALLKKLLAAETWPEAFRKAHFTISQITADGSSADLLPAQQWKGRVLDASACGELEKIAIAAAEAGRMVAISAVNQGPLSGIRLSIKKAVETIPLQIIESGSFPNLESGVQPSALFSCTLLPPSAAESRAQPLAYMRPLWRTPAENQQWREQHLKPGEESKAGYIDPTSLQKELARRFQLSPADRGAFQLYYQVAAFSEATTELDEEIQPEL
jgi:hypothetical protein